MSNKIESMLFMVSAFLLTMFILITALVVADFIEWTFYDKVSKPCKLVLDLFFGAAAIIIYCGWLKFFKRIKIGGKQRDRLTLTNRHNELESQNITLMLN
jgi:hypothetical protein